MENDRDLQIELEALKRNLDRLAKLLEPTKVNTETVISIVSACTIILVVFVCGLIITNADGCARVEGYDENLWPIYIEDRALIEARKESYVNGAILTICIFCIPASFFLIIMLVRRLMKEREDKYSKRLEGKLQRIREVISEAVVSGDYENIPELLDEFDRR